jgi:hypothetical protein
MGEVTPPFSLGDMADDLSQTKAPVAAFNKFAFYMFCADFSST